MNDNRLYFWNSIVTRFALFFTILMVFAILISGYLVFRKASQRITENSRAELEHSAELAEQAFYALLNEVSNDIGFIADLPSLEGFVNDPSLENRQQLDQVFRAMLNSKDSYFQIRFIGVAEDGRELIRIERKEDQIFQTPEAKLQSKGDRDYFREALGILPGQLYYSEINLNQEFGEVSEPLIPTLRAATPIVNREGKTFGIVVINVDLTDFFEDLGRISRSGADILIVDHSGQFIYNRDPEKRFGSQLGSNYGLRDEFPSVDSNKNKGVIDSEDGRVRSSDDSWYLISRARLSYYDGKRTLWLYSIIREQVVTRVARQVRAESLQTLGIFCLISILFSLLFTSLFSGRINQITYAISQYDTGTDDDIQLPTERKDEIGVLARTFTRMRETIRKQLNDLNVALDEEKRAKRERDEFLQNMSHEMRTPLNAITGLIQVLKRNKHKKSQLPVIQSLERSAQTLSGLVYDVLDHQKLVEGKVRINLEPVYIGKLLHDIRASYVYEALEKGLDFQVTVSEDLAGNQYLTDQLRLSQIVTNLVVNAIKYTEKGSIHLRADLIGSAETKLKIELSDTGIGIHPDNLEKINDRFFREDEGLVSHYGGYGLGLSIVKQLVDLFGGELQAISEKEKGSTFTVTIPLVKVDEMVDTTDAKGKLPRPFISRPVTILHIEDDPSNRELVRHLFDGETWEFLQIGSIEQLNEVDRTPDLIISDLIIREHRMVKELPQWMRLKNMECPVLVVSAMEASEMKALSDHYVQKPFEVDILLDEVYVLLGEGEFTPPDFSALYANYDHKPAMMAKSLKLLEGEFNNYLDRIEKALVNKDQKTWDAIMHRLIAHIKQLKLRDIERLLSDDIHEIAEPEPILNAIRWYILCIRAERRRIEIDN